MYIIQELKIHFNIGEDYDQYDAGDDRMPNLDAIKTLHGKLVSSGEAAQKIKLLSFYERGRLYGFITRSIAWQGSFEETCRLLGVCKTTAYRYIQFTQFIDCYPRLLACSLSYESIMTHSKRLREYLKVQTSLRDRLKLPMKEIKLCATELTFCADKLPDGSGEEPDYNPKDHDYTEGYLFSDRLRDAQESEEAFAGYEDDDYDDEQALAENFARQVFFYAACNINIAL